MVRLKGKKEIYRSLATRFQFHYGSIKSPFRLIRYYRLWYFNSTMVRLKGRICKNGGDHSKFQFHYGSIKRYAAGTDYSPATLISIPLWFD